MDQDSANSDFSPIRARVLVVSARPSLKRRLESMFDGVVESLRFARGGSAASRVLDEGVCDLMVVDRLLPGEDGLDVLEAASARCPGMLGVVIVDAPSAEDAVRAMQSGACDLIAPRTSAGEVRRRIASAARKAERNRTRDERIGRLRKLCHTLQEARTRVSGQVGELCNDLVDAYRDMSGQLADTRMTGELETLLRQELDIEGLLRTMLEYTLAKIGPTNAAVFLPSTGGEYSLGAYVNQDVPKDQAELMLDHLADSLAPMFEGRPGVHAIRDDREMAAWLGADSHWMENRSIIAFSCEADDECLGVVALFRDRSRDFSEQDEHLVSLIGGLFTDQLERVIRIHHRHLPKDTWGVIDPPAQDDSDDLGFEGYGRAA